MDREEVARLFWKRIEQRQYELHYTATFIQSETSKLTGKTYRLTESKCRNVLPDTYTIRILAEILQTTTDYLLGFVDSSGEITAKEAKVLEQYRTNKRIKVIIDNLIELTY